MASPLKDLYSASFYNQLADSIARVLPSFNKQQFIALLLDEAFESKELKERMKHTAAVLHQFLSADYPQAVKQIQQIIGQLRKDRFGEDRLESMFFPDYIETYGLHDYEPSIAALEFVTQFVSCEYAVRPFLLRYGKKMLQQMKTWSRHESAKVRRLASEGSRPRLPWAIAVPALKQDPTPILPILENLKNDPSDSVRRSVANSLNDIAKDHPGVVLAIAAKWKGQSPAVDAIIKHGCRTLLKQGHTEILKHYGLESKHITLQHFTILTPVVKTGSNLDFSFTITNKSNSPQTVRLEYAVYYRKQNGQPSKKVFKISERTYQPKEQITVQRRQKFTPITTRTYYAGQHQLSIIVNGEEKGIDTFELAD